jgi:hypothetical protein
MARADIICAVPATPQQYNGAGVNYIVQKNGATNTFYLFYIDSGSDVAYVKTTDGGISWSNPVIVFTGTTVAVSVWYDRWSGISADVVHLAYTESGGGDVLYRPLDISTDTLGTQTTIFNGASSAAGGALTICVDRGGHIRCVFNIDNGTEDGAASSADAGATWGDTIADPTEGATTDQFFLLPGWNADNHDMMLVFVDASANGLSLKRYDDSADSWAETAIIADASFVDQTAANAFPNVSCFVDLANSRNVVAGWTGVDTATADLRCFILTDGAITETATNIVLNSTDDQGLCSLALDTGSGTWYAFYGGKSDGSETYPSAINIYYKTSTDAGATWGSETLLSSTARGTQYLISTPRFATEFLVVWLFDQATDILLTAATMPSGSGGGMIRHPGMAGGLNG